MLSNLESVLALAIAKLKTDRMEEIARLLDSDAANCLDLNDLSDIRVYLDRILTVIDQKNEKEWERQNRFRIRHFRGKGRRSKSKGYHRVRHTPRFTLLCFSRFISYIVTYYEKTKNLGNDPQLYYRRQRTEVEYAGTGRIRVRHFKGRKDVDFS